MSNFNDIKTFNHYQTSTGMSLRMEPALVQAKKTLKRPMMKLSTKFRSMK